MAFDRLVRYVAARREFKEDRDAHVTNLRLLETYLEQAKDWLPILVKSTTPTQADVQSGTSAIVFVGNDAYLWKPTTKEWVKLKDGLDYFYYLQPTEQRHVGSSTSASKATFGAQVENPYVNTLLLYDGASYVNQTLNLVRSDSGISGGITLLADTNDIAYFGIFASPFTALQFDMATNGVGLTLVWEYWDGVAWSPLTVSGDAAGLAADGSVTWDAPSDWAKISVNGTGNQYFVRVRTTTVPGTAPKANKINRALWDAPFMLLERAGAPKAYLDRNGTLELAGSIYPGIRASLQGSRGFTNSYDQASTHVSATNGSPEGVVNGDNGSLVLRRNGEGFSGEPSLYVKTTDDGFSTGWMPVGTHVPLTVKTAAYTATDEDCVILCNATGGAFTITLPTAAFPRKGRKYVIKKTDASANAVTVDANGAQTIDGALTQVLAARWDSITIVSDGSNWVILARVP